MLGFIFWTVVILIFVPIGISAWNSKEPVGFFISAKPPKIPEANVKKYNHAVGIIWFAYAGGMEVLGLPLLFFEQNSPYFVITILGAVILSIGIMVVYFGVEKHYLKE